MVSNFALLALVGFGCESFLYGASYRSTVFRTHQRWKGAYCVLFLASLFVLVWIRKQRGTNKIIVTFHICVFAACSAHYSMELYNYYWKLVGHIRTMSAQIAEQSYDPRSSHTWKGSLMKHRFSLWPTVSLLPRTTLVVWF